MILRHIRRFLAKAHHQKNVPRIPATEHRIPEQLFSPHALQIVHKLVEHGFEAYIVGGGVRDLILGQHPKDFDVATNAKPEQIRKIFRHSRIIGRRFKLIHVFFNREIIEVATFRAAHGKASERHAKTNQGVIVRDNVYGTLEEDAWRRDFTMNALYYDVRDQSLIDYTGGFLDLCQGIIRIIGQAEQRYQEDPVRMLRAVRFACKLGLKIEPSTEAPLHALHHGLSHIPAPRLFEEFLKLFFSGQAYKTFYALNQYQLLKHLLPIAEKEIHHNPAMIDAALKATDDRLARGKSVNPAFLLACFHWYALKKAMQPLLADRPLLETLYAASEDLMKVQQEKMFISRRYMQDIQDIWQAQFRFEKRRGKTPYHLIEMPRFRAALDFLELRLQCGEPVKELFTWWSEFYTGNAKERDRLLKKMQENHIAYIGVGSNLKNPRSQVEIAFKNLGLIRHSQVLACSSILETPPLDHSDQPNYFNAVVKLNTRLLPYELLAELQTIEAAQERVRTEYKFSPRTLDLDILLYDNLSLKEPHLTIPHYDLENRDFYLKLLLELSPHLVLPNGKKVASLESSMV